MNKKLSNFYLAIAIIGIITAVPVLGSLFDVFRILTLILLGFSIYLLIKQPKEIKKTAVVLMIVSCTLSLMGSLIFLAVAGSIATQDTSASYESSKALGTMISGSFIGIIFAFPAWILKIIAIIFSFQTSNKLKSLD